MTRVQTCVLKEKSHQGTCIPHRKIDVKLKWLTVFHTFRSKQELQSRTHACSLLLRQPYKCVNHSWRVKWRLYAKTEEKKINRAKNETAFIKWATIPANENVLLLLTFTNIKQFDKILEQEYLPFVPSEKKWCNKNDKISNIKLRLIKQQALTSCIIALTNWFLQIKEPF